MEHLKPTWTSSNNSIISITEDGQIKGLAIGKATITLLLNNIEENKPALEATLIIEVISRWFTDAGLTNEFTEAIPITSNITVYAKWEAVVIPI